MDPRLAIDGGPAVFPDGPPRWPLPDPAIRAVLDEAWASGAWGKYHGPHHDQLQSALSTLHGNAEVYLCSSGTIGVELGLRGLGISPGDEVIVAGYDFPGNFRAIEAIGAFPVIADIRTRNWCLDPESVAASVGPATKAVIVSHLHGGLADMPAICEIAHQHGLSILEDVCQAPGAMVHGRLAGMWGDVAVWSFGGSKLITAGRGGAVISPRPEVIQRIRVFADRGNEAFPLSELQAAVLGPQLAALPQRNAQRRAAVSQLLATCAGVAAFVPLDISPNEGAASYYKFGWLLNDGGASTFRREDWVRAIQAEGVALDAGFRGFANRSSARCRKAGPLPHSRTAATATLILHHPVLLEALEAVALVGTVLAKVASAFSQSDYRGRGA